MAKYLRLADDPRGERWSLAEDADLEELRLRISGAMNDGVATVVRVTTSDGKQANLVVNGRAVTSVVLWEDAGRGEGHKPSFTMID